jgi:serine/threonine-protein kinase RsbW
VTSDPERGDDALSIEERIAEDAETLFDRAPCGYLTTLMDGTIVRVNATLLEWTRYERDQLLGRRRFVDLLSAGDRIYHETHFAPLLALQGALREVAFDVVRGDGTRLPVLVNASIETEPDGSPVLVRVTLFDATMRREYERELVRARTEERAAREHLERLHAELSMEAHRSRLRAELGAALDVERDMEGRVTRLLELVRRAVADDAWFIEAGPGDAPHVPEAPAARRVVQRALDSGAPHHADAASIVYLALPIGVQSRSVGVLLLAREAPQSFTPDDVGFLADLASRAALSLDNARLYEHERATAHALQQSLLAGTLPHDPRLEIATFYRPGIDGLEVGGDWFDAFSLSPDHIAVVVGDVVGRGLSAAAAMGKLRSGVRALAATGFSPGPLLDGLDIYVEADDSGRYATLVYLDVDLARTSARLASAGHPPIIISDARGARVCWEGRSAPLGVHAPGTSRPETSLQLAVGTRLLLVTDGIVERRATAIDAGLNVLTDTVNQSAGIRLPAMLATVIRDLLDNTPADDDACALAVELH